ncbi:MAG: WD40/YVTN/BNR-like repeat-containing protein [Gammaproteobacteria bacterium]
MARSVHPLGFLGAAALLAVAAFSTAAQDEAPAIVVKPRPAERMALAPKSLLLDVVRAGDRFVAVGDRGAILLSADGKDWEQAEGVPARAAFTAATFVDAEHGWAVGHDAAIVATGDGGKTWALQNFQPELEKPLLDVLFLDARRGFAVGAYGLLLATADGGKTWKEQDSPIREDEVHFNSITRLGNGSLLIAGESGMLAASSDQGRSWSKLRSPYDGTFFGSLPTGAGGALLFGMRGNAYLTADVRSGRWTKLQTNSVASMIGGTALPDGALAMVGLNGTIFVADAAGKVRSLHTPAGTPLAAAVPLDGGLLAVGESGVQLVQSLQ